MLRLPGVQVTTVCDVDAGRVKAAAAAIETVAKKSDHPAPKPVGDFRRILDDKAVDVLIVRHVQPLARPGRDPGVRGRQARLRREAVQPQPARGRAAGRGRPQAQAARADGQPAAQLRRRSSRRSSRSASGAIGRAYFAQSWYINNRPPIGHGKPADPPEGLDYDLWQGPAPRRPFHDNYLHYNWHWFWHWGNGELGNNGVHMIDLCRWGLGVDYPIARHLRPAAATASRTTRRRPTRTSSASIRRAEDDHLGRA